MIRRKDKVKTCLIRINEDTKNELDQLRNNPYVKLSYNNIIEDILSNQEQLELYKLCSKLISKIQEGERPFKWEYERLQKYIEEHENKRI